MGLSVASVGDIKAGLEYNIDLRYVFLFIFLACIIFVNY